MKILIVGPSWVGDMVMSQTLYIELKKTYPNASIDVLAPAWCKPILERMPQISKAIETIALDGYSLPLIIVCAYPFFAK